MRALLTVLAASVLAQPAAPDGVRIEYPLEGSVFPPDMEPPTLLFRDSSGAAVWQAKLAFASGAEPIADAVRGDTFQPGEIDPRCAAPTNRPPELPPEIAGARAWKPDAKLWETARLRAAGRPFTVSMEGLRDGRAVSRGAVSISFSKDPAGAPIFYRDVPLMPSELEKGVIKPLAPKLLPYIAWRLRYLDEPSSRVLLEGMHTCANCHSFSSDGKTLGLDLDGPHNDKGLYAIVAVRPRMSIRNEDVISWKQFRNQMERDKRIGFMSQVSPDGRYVVTATQVQYYVANFQDYRFLQVFYPTRGILAWYDRSSGKVHPLPGADDPRYVHSNAVWSPDGRYLVFSRAKAADSYPKGRKMAEYANDTNEVPIQYELYRIPFNGGAGGKAEPIAGASANGMSNSFPKVSPDGRWIVFVQSRNGQLMRPDGKLYIVPAAGGEARLMRCNTPLMNSWHSFSPNGRWMVFASKSRSPYTQLFLTHIDEDGNDSPAILIENSTAANRAANIPEFVNIPRGGMLAIDAPAAEFYRLYDLAYELGEKGRAPEAVAAWREALKLEPKDAKALNNLGGLLLKQGRLDEAVEYFRQALASDPDLVDAHNNMGLVLMQRGRLAEAQRHFRESLDAAPESAGARVNLGGVYLLQGRYAEAARLLREAEKLEPGNLTVLKNLAWILSTCPDGAVRNGAEALRLAARAAELAGGRDVVVLDALGAAYAELGRFPEAASAAGQAIALASSRNDQAALEALKARLRLYRSARPFREPRPGAPP
ncbi:MAG: tetratricopeptide repeat protein [Bryobacteraceae bacterium]|nr:tetratricopeptide repeat protein [Bryobacteraceae bacterium]